MLVCAVPPIILTGVLAVGLLAIPLGVDFLWPVPTLTLSESAALRDAATVRLAIDRGDDLTAASPVRAGIFGPAVVLTPVEAAAMAGYGEMVRLLLDEGHLHLRVGDAERLACIARRYDRHEIRALMDERYPATADVDCGRVRLPRRSG